MDEQIQTGDQTHAGNEQGRQAQGQIIQPAPKASRRSIHVLNLHAPPWAIGPVRWKI
jgi:hypothetical protein